MSKVDFGEDFSATASVQEVRNEGKRVPILTRNAIKASEVHAKPKFAGFLFDE